MKNFVLIIVGIIAIIFENSVLNYIKIFDFTPNILIIYLSIISLCLKKYEGAYIGAVLGLVKDILVCRFIGLNAIILFTIGIACGILKDKIFKDSILNICIVVYIASIFDSTINYTFTNLFLNNETFILYLYKGVFIIPMFNSILTFFVHDLLRDFLEKIESF